jgi:hypothetical protein
MRGVKQGGVEMIAKPGRGQRHEDDHEHAHAHGARHGHRH